MVAFLCFFSGSVFAQTLPDAGSILKEIREDDRDRPSDPAPPNLITPTVRPTIRLPDGATVRVNRFKFSGNTAIAAKELQAIIGPWEGQTLDVAGLNDAAGAVTRYYQTRGFLLTYAYLPVQKIENDVIEIAVLEGYMGGVQVVAAQDVRLDDAVVQRHLKGVTTVGATKPAHQDDIERSLLLLNDIPGVVARGAFTPGAQPGSSDLVVSVVEEDPLANTLYVNNHGSSSTGETRAGAQFHLKDVFGVGDSTRANLSWSSGGLIASGGLSTRVPLGGDGFAVSAGASHMTYELAGEFATLGARGEANTLQAGASYPLLRSANRNLGMQLDFEQKYLRDLIPLIALETQKSSTSASAGANFDARDAWAGGGRNRLSAMFQSGVLTLAARAADALGKSGSFSKTTIDVSREQSLSVNGQLYARLLAQRAGKNLDSSEKFTLGGPGAVRAYGPGEVSVDDGALLTIEYRYQQPLTGAMLTWRIFYDRAAGRVDTQPLAGSIDNDVALHGSGLGVNWSGSGNLDIALTAAWRGERVPSANGDRAPRVYMQLVKGF
jgi:hemolysin activation/secretion protein